MAIVKMLCRKTDRAVVPAMDDTGLVKVPCPLLVPDVAEAEEVAPGATLGLWV